METRRLIVDAAHLSDAVSQSSLNTAARILRDGGTVAFPTETVYGLGANALRAEAVARIFEAKQRPSWDPLIVHIADMEMLRTVAESIPAAARVLLDLYWPGPLTLLLPRHAQIPDIVTAGRPRVGVRMPQHPVAQALIRAAGVPVAAPSANTFGHISPTSAQHVADDLDGRIDAILDAGDNRRGFVHGLESTVVDVCEDPWIVYRPGVITLEQIQAISSSAFAYEDAARDASETPAALPSPGVGLRHYAPRARLLLVPDGPGQADRLRAQMQAVPAAGRGLMLPDQFAGGAEGIEAIVYPWGDWSNPQELASRLYAGLRWLDAHEAKTIVCPLPEAKAIGIAIRDRLQKAARAES